MDFRPSLFAGQAATEVLSGDEITVAEACSFQHYCCMIFDVVSLPAIATIFIVTIIATLMHLLSLLLIAVLGQWIWADVFVAVAGICSD